MTEEQLRELFREMRDEPVPADSLVRMRSGVAAGLSRRRWFRVGWLVAATAFLTLLAVIFKPAAGVPQALPPLFAVYPAVPLLSTTLAPAPVARRAHVKRPMATRRAVQPLVIRIETDDPTIVILLTGE